MTSAPAGVRFVKHQMGVVITTRRFLMFGLGGFPRARADELLTDVPVGEVDSIECVGHSFKSFEAKLTIPHFYLTVDTEIDDLLKLRAEIKAAAPREALSGSDRDFRGRRQARPGVIEIRRHGIFEP